MLPVLAMLAVVVTMLLPIPAAGQNPNLEVIHHPKRLNHKPTSTNIAVLELGEPEQLIEIQVVAVVD